MMIDIIGFSAVAGGGKDTAGKRMQKWGYEVAHFADPMKDMLRLAFPMWDKRHTHGDLKEIVDPQYGVSPRHALQTLGTEWGRSISEDLWIRATLDKVSGPTCICDVRFPNEAEAIRAAGGLVVRLTRGEKELRERLLTEDVHPSETALLDRDDLFDAIIDNTRSLSAFLDVLDWFGELWRSDGKQGRSRDRNRCH